MHLFSQARGTLRYDDALAAFVPGTSVAASDRGSGRCGRTFAISPARSPKATPWASARRNARVSRRADDSAAPRAEPVAQAQSHRCGPLPRRVAGAKRFVDMQNDVGVDDIALAAREGYQSVEHLKRYTTLGMGTDQGKTTNIIGLALLAEHAATRRSPASARRPSGRRTRRSRSARSPGARSARTSSRRATRRCTTGTSRTARASSQRGCGCAPHSYPRAGESADDAANREAQNVRTQRRAGRRLDAGQDRAAGHATSPSSSTASTATAGPRSASAAAATA